MVRYHCKVTQNCAESKPHAMYRINTSFINDMHNTKDDLRVFVSLVEYIVVVDQECGSQAVHVDKECGSQAVCL